MSAVNLEILLTASLSLTLVWTMVTDIRHRIIPNWVVLVVIALAPAMWFISDLALWPEIVVRLLLASLCFVIFAAIFATGKMGGGDVKLLAALALWITPAWFLKLILMMSLLGGLLTIILALWHGLRRRRERLAIPYGVAIASAGLWALASQFVFPAQSALPAGALG